MIINHSPFCFTSVFYLYLCSHHTLCIDVFVQYLCAYTCYRCVIFVWLHVHVSRPLLHKTVHACMCDLKNTNYKYIHIKFIYL